MPQQQHTTTTCRRQEGPSTRPEGGTVDSHGDMSHMRRALEELELLKISSFKLEAGWLMSYKATQP